MWSYISDSRKIVISLEVVDLDAHRILHFDSPLISLIGLFAIQTNSDTTVSPTTQVPAQSTQNSAGNITAPSTQTTPSQPVTTRTAQSECIYPIHQSNSL
ncbi:hypothetical protein D915_010351 [Fasciola hepatica]|uniref:Uncharacterized protein n=1 Tax=Fasciola hepatica TaxID=6192 RepID=A0A4E0RPC9_FASHE|nr:hypothetical protein D915_010351 [Fasciola hepatica]